MSKIVNFMYIPPSSSSNKNPNISLLTYLSQNSNLRHRKDPVTLNSNSMFSRWEFVRPAEAFWSRLDFARTVKRVCKFLLKKKLGDFILGDIDLEQLEVQITQGTIHLSDLALNVDFINQKLAGSSVMVEEGSIGSLSVKIPWTLQNCQIEVDELELVLAPFVSADVENTSLNSTIKSEDKIEPEYVEARHKNTASSVSLEIHEGVKTVAKIVKWFLTSFHVRLKNLIVAFDPLSELDENKSFDSRRSLVLRIAEIEYGTHVSEDPKTDSILGKAKLTNFVKFQGAVVEFLKMDDVDKEIQNDSHLCTSFSEWHTKSQSVSSTTTVLTGANSGFAGTLNLCIPWKNGSLDIRKVDGDLSVDPIEIILRPNTIKWILAVYESLQNVGSSSSNKFNYKVADSQSSVSSNSDLTKVSKGKSRNSYSEFMEDTSPDTFLSQTHVIQNWVPLSRNDDFGIGSEQDYGASIDQFFECFDGIRSSQAGSSGIWNWTCSVFSAITVASNLATGSVHIPIEQHNVETSLQATIQGVSLLYNDEDSNYSHVLNNAINQSTETYGASNMSNSNLDGQNFDSYMSCYSSMIFDQSATTETKYESPSVHQLRASCQNLLFTLQISPQKTNLEASVMHFKVDEYRDSKNQSILNLNLQNSIQESLPTFKFPVEEQNSASFMNTDSQKSQNGLMKVVIFESFGLCRCHCSISSTDIDKRTVTSTSFSLDLPSFIFWIHFPSVNRLLNFCKMVENYIEEANVNNKFVYGDTKLQKDSVNHAYITTVSSSSNLQGKVKFSRARVVVCSPSDLDKFIGLELYPCIKANTSDPIPFAAKSSTSIHFSIGDFDLYLIDHAQKYAVSNKFAVKILSCINRSRDNDNEISIICQNGSVTGTWMAARTWNMASLYEQSRNKVTGKSSEFSSMATGDFNGKCSNLRQELILSSAFFLHFHFSDVCIDLHEHAYNMFNQLVDDILNEISGKTERSATCIVDVTQTCFLVDIDVLNINVVLGKTVEVNHSIEKELQGSWNSAKLKIEKLELLSVSDIGGVNLANFFWLSHGECELWGSVFDRCESSQDFLLVACKMSSARRGDGDGGNALSFGLPGTTVLYMWNPQSSQSFTAVGVHCVTVVAPGGRLDWINAICLFFSSSSEDIASNGDDVKMESRKGHFFLDLVDAALSYEPHNNVFVSSGKIDEKPVAGILAAASLSLSSCNTGNLHCETTSYNIQLKDVGLLLCESSGLRTGNGYHPWHLSKSGYVKVAHIPLFKAILRMKGVHWKVDCSDSHINIGTCQDTTDGLIQLVAQLQQLYAPDMEDCIAHLQSRWNVMQQKHNANFSNEVEGNDLDDTVKANSEMKQSSDSDDHIFTGLLDEIFENAFKVKKDADISNDDHKLQSHFILDDMHFKDSISVEHKSTKSSPHIIESYYMSEQLQPLKSILNTSLSSSSNSKSDVCFRKDIECGGVWYRESSFTLVEDHVSKSDSPERTSDNLQESHRLIDDKSSKAKGKVVLRNIDVRWRMYAGLDWFKPNRDSQSKKHFGRDKNKSLELTILGLDVLYSLYPDGGIILSKLSVCVQSLQLYDKSKDAPWTLILGDYTKGYPRKSYAKALKLNLEVVRPDLSIPIEDYRLILELRPIRLHLDQVQLSFLIDFFGKESFTEECSIQHNDICESELENSQSRILGNQTIVQEALLPFFQICVVKPFVICVDYIPRHIDLKALRKGNYTELLNLVPWKGIELKLKQASAVDVYGLASVCETIGGQWLEDISQNQVHKLLKGLAPIRSLLAVSSGTSKLVSLPVKSYKKDQKLLKGLQRGAIAFLRSVSLEAVGLGVHLAAGAHETLWKTQYFLTSVPSSEPISDRTRAKTTVRLNQPEDAQQGIHQAYESISDGLGRTASALIGTPLKVYQRGGGAGSALVSAVRGVPTAAIAPVAASARAVHYTLVGVRNSLDPEHKRESKEKYHGSSRS